MQLKAKVGGSLELAPAGTHKARCIRVVDLGSHKSEKFNNLQHKIMFLFELPETEMSDGKCFSIAAFYNLSFHEKSKLRPFIESWRSKAFTDNEAEEFNILKLLDVPAFINVIHNDGLANISSIMPLKNSDCPERMNDLLAFSLSDFDENAFGKLSERLQDRIKESREYKDMINSEPADESQNEPDIDNEEDDEDLPF